MVILWFPQLVSIVAKSDNFVSKTDLELGIGTKTDNWKSVKMYITYLPGFKYYQYIISNIYNLFT